MGAKQENIYARMADALEKADALLPERHWLFAKGKLSPDEPMYGFSVYEDWQIYEPTVLTEHNDPVQCVLLAVEEIRKRCN